MAKDHSTTKHSDTDGSFRRQGSTFRSFITKNGEFPPEKGRYVLYIALICPWATRAAFVRALKGLEDIIEIAITDYELTPKGWSFSKRTKEATGDPVYGKEYIREVYHVDDPDYSLRYTVPMLFDKKQGRVVNNESSEIIRILYTAFDDLLSDDSPSKGVNYYPEAHAKEIDELNGWIYDKLNNGVYKTGFASTQEIYDAEVGNVFDGMDRLESILSDGREFLVPEAGLSEADIRLLPTLLRFDAAYVTLFKCNIRTIRDGYPHIHKYMRSLYWSKKTSVFRDWTNFDHIKKGYASVGNKITPAGPIPSILPLDS
ncbi:hypothetical protein CBS101457_005301 [Exobasidium rhododendri]|nr:hypothetical protein CBS101457_005301 [Exobasidium rhododendri]